MLDEAIINWKNTQISLDEPFYVSKAACTLITTLVLKTMERFSLALYQRVYITLSCLLNLILCVRKEINQVIQLKLSDVLF